MNSIIEATESKNRLEAIFKNYFKNNKAVFDLGIDPETGFYTIIAKVENPRQYGFLPDNIDSYKIFASLPENNETY
jgi:hypothetical protein